MTDISKPILFGDNGVDAAIVTKFRHEHFMVRSLTRVFVAQQSLDKDITAWTEPASGKTDDVIAWLQG